jgi:hypothetical protein
MNVYETKRYEPDFSYESGLPGMFETSKGGYVAHGDYATLFSELEGVKAERDALAVENAALKSAHPQPFGREMMKALDAYEKHQDEVPETGMLDAFFILRDSIRVETQATDAALAAIESRGVEKLIWSFKKITNSDSLGKTRKRIAMRLIEHAVKFSAELREAK